jgi:hypothetical protein
MTEPAVLPDVVERFLDEPVAAPPLAELLTVGEGAARRRRRRGVAAAAAAVLVIAGGAYAGQAALRPDHREPTADPDVARPTTVGPPAGTRWAGIGRVVLAVPEGWSDGRVRCNQPIADTVYFPADVSRSCRIVGPFSSLAISDHPFDLGDTREHTDGEVAGHPVLVAANACADIAIATCSADVSVPELGAYFRITIHGRRASQRVEELRETLTALPDDQVAIPDAPTRLDEAKAALESAGLEPDVQMRTCGAMDLCLMRPWIDPAPGRVVPVGTTVTINVMTPQGTAADPLGGLQCGTSQWSTGDIDVVPPASPDEAREQGWPTSAEQAVEGMVDAPAWSRFGNLTLSEGVVVEPGTVRFALIDDDGLRVVVLTVQELVRGAWAVTQMRSCAG